MSSDGAGTWFCVSGRCEVAPAECVDSGDRGEGAKSGEGRDRVPVEAGGGHWP
jgi:hypothetical protein